jgi:periplasmic protein TonB
MASAPGRWNRDHMRAGAGAAALQVLLLSGLAAGLRVAAPEPKDPAPVVLAVRPVPPPPIIPPPERKTEEGASAPAPAAASPVVAPPTVLPVPLLVVAAPVPATSAAPTPGISPVAGTGAGGQGTGTGRGGAGSGGGTSARRVAGALRDSDYPAAARRARAEGTVFVEFRVDTDGGVSGCKVTRSSGHEALDAVTCRLIERRFRYQPATDARGAPVAATLATNFTWTLRPPEVAPPAAETR